MKKKRDWVRGFKSYNLFASNVWLLITTILAGVLIGYFLDRNHEDTHYTLLFTIIFFVLGITYFFVSIFLGLKKLSEEEEKNKTKETDSDEEENVEDEID